MRPESARSPFSLLPDSFEKKTMFLEKQCMMAIFGTLNMVVLWEWKWKVQGHPFHSRQQPPRDESFKRKTMSKVGMPLLIPQVILQ